ncbi:MAG: hypothetical protein M3R70_04860 [Actinomycetota bacterium]|nr:hypothetical protein [Actinomycetota bacterium]
MYLQHLSSLEFLTYVAFFGVVVAALFKFLPGRSPPLREKPYPDEELGAHDRKTAKYFLAGGGFLVLGALHMVVKNVPWIAERLARTGYAGHLVRDLSNTHVMIVGGGTLLATGLTWLVLPKIVGRPLASEGLAQCAFWFTAGGLAVFYVSLVGNGIAIGRLVEHGSDYQAAKEHLGKWYKVPTGMGAGVMGLGYWCFATNVVITIFQSRLVKVHKPQWHLWKFFATGAAALTVGTIQGVIQVTPANADWLYKAGHAGEWIDPISHAHVNLVTGLAMLVAGALFALVRAGGGIEPSRRLVNTCFFAVLGGSLAFYFAALYLGFHEGRLVHRGLTPEQAEQATAIHPYLIMGAGVAMFAAFWLLLAVIARSVWRAGGPLRTFVLAGCAALALGTLQGPVQAFPAVNELLDRGGDAGDVIVNLHAQLNMLGGLMVILMGLAFVALREHGGELDLRRARLAVIGVSSGIGVYYLSGVAFAAFEAHRVSAGGAFADAVAATEPWQAFASVPAALAVLAGFCAYFAATWRLTKRQRSEGRKALAAVPGLYTGKIPRRVLRRSPAALAGYELPLGLMGFPGVGWLFAGFPFTASILLCAGPALAWAVIPVAFSPYGQGPLRDLGWKVELVWLPASALLSSALLYRAHARRRRLLDPPQPPTGRARRTRSGYRARVGIAIGSIAVVLVCLPFVPAVVGIGSSSVRYSCQPRFTREVTGQFLQTRRCPVKLFAWSDPQASYPVDALRVHAADVRSFSVRAAAVDAPGAYQLFDLDRGGNVPLAVRSRAPTILKLAPARSLRTGRYAFVAAHEGMFGGRDYNYLTVAGPGDTLTAISAHSRRMAPPVADALLPLAAALIALLFAAKLALSALRRPAGQKVLWALGFALFAAAAASEAVAHRSGWSPELFRTYYLTGGVLTVAYLGAGSAWLLLPKRARAALVGTLVVVTVAAGLTVLLAPLDSASLSAATGARPPSNDVLGGHAYLWAVALNTFGTLFLVGGSLYSVVRRRRVRMNLWIAGGALVVALATGLSRTGTYSLVYAGELVGIGLMFAGFSFSGHAAPAKRVAARQALATR